MQRFLLLSLGLLTLLGCSPKPELNEAMIKDLINPLLSKQEVIIKSPGFPSKLEAMVLVLEDPSLPDNQHKRYHPAEKLGWEQMLEYARAFEKSQVLRFETGTFDEHDYFDKPFTFHGHRLHIEGDLKQDTVILPALGKVGFKLGRSCVTEVSSFTEPVKEGKDYVFDFTVKVGVCELKNWSNPEILRLSGVEAVLPQSVTLKGRCHQKKCAVIADKYIESISKPKLLF
ncbi:MAG: hypothetical protein K6F05_04490 [Succinivibrio sp.]|nr:hypothetical protein [Succinivibrio sp.]